MTDTPEPVPDPAHFGPAPADAAAGAASDGSDPGTMDGIGDTTVRRPRVPARRDPVALAEPEMTGDTIVVRRGLRRRPTAEAIDGPAESAPESPAGVATAYSSRAAAPVRGSRKAPASARADEPTSAAWMDPPDAAAIERRRRSRARRRLLGLALAIAVLVVALLGALAVLVFAVGV